MPQMRRFSISFSQRQKVLREMRVYGEIECMSSLSVTLFGSQANDMFYESKVRAYAQMTTDDIRKEIERLSPNGVFDALAYFLEPRRELAHDAACQVLEERLR